MSLHAAFTLQEHVWCMYISIPCFGSGDVPYQHAALCSWVLCVYIDTCRSVQLSQYCIVWHVVQSGGASAPACKGFVCCMRPLGTPPHCWWPESAAAARLGVWASGSHSSVI
jgi:hypothetical protein